MKVKPLFSLYIITSMVCIIISCGNQEKKTDENTAFTKVDSLTDTYLVLQDSLLKSWNAIIKDENEKLETMDAVLKYALNKGAVSNEQIQTLTLRLEQLKNIRITQSNLSNPYVVDEYDFASNSLINEIISLSESDPSFLQNKKLQAWIDEIKTADQRVPIYRSEYDSLATQFNYFLEKNKEQLMGVDKNLMNEKKPLFKID